MKTACARKSNDTKPLLRAFNFCLTAYQLKTRMIIAQFGNLATVRVPWGKQGLVQWPLFF